MSPVFPSFAHLHLPCFYVIQSFLLEYTLFKLFCEVSEEEDSSRWEPLTGPNELWALQNTDSPENQTAKTRPVT